jgi:hypothetical protein
MSVGRRFMDMRRPESFSSSLSTDTSSLRVMCRQYERTGVSYSSPSRGMRAIWIGCMPPRDVFILPSFRNEQEVHLLVHSAQHQRCLLVCST